VVTETLLPGFFLVKNSGFFLSETKVSVPFQFISLKKWRTLRFVSLVKPLRTWWLKFFTTRDTKVSQGTQSVEFAFVIDRVTHSGFAVFYKKIKSL